ncbi:putative Cytochrome b2 [Seiridium cardinale]
MLTRSEVEEHASEQSCWIIIDNSVYDVTDFLDSHPGGATVILKYGGGDATAAFTPIHPADTLQKFLKPQQKLGYVPGNEPIRKSRDASAAQKRVNNESLAVQPAHKRIKLSSIISISDFEKIAATVLPPRSFAFFKTGAEDEYALDWNRGSWKYVRFRPRGLRPIENVDTSCTILGNKFSIPFFICPAGGGKLANPAGEVLMTKATGKHGVLHWVCNGAGCTQEEMAAARTADQTLYWQIYMKADLKISEQEIRNAVALGYKGFALTIDAIRAGKRESDVRASLSEEAMQQNDDAEEDSESHEREPTVKRPPVWSSFDWPSAVKWMRGITDLPIAIKGIQCWEDAALCLHYGVHPWLSNHGGRQLDSAPSAIETLVEMRQHCPEVFDRCEVIVDGGVERGSDIVKALALGAKAVGLGRAFLYSLVLGEAGVTKAIKILKHEIETTMALLGVQQLSELNSSYVDVSGLRYGASFPRPRL